MNSFKKLITAATLLTMVVTSKICCVPSSNNTITEAEAKTYVGNSINELFMPNHNNPTVVEFKIKETIFILNSTYHIWYALFHKDQKIYDFPTLKDKTYNKVLFFIKDEAKRKVYLLIKSFNIKSFFIENMITSSVIKIIMDRANNLIYGYVEAGRLASFVGSDLETQVRKLIKDEIMSQTPQLTDLKIKPTPHVSIPPYLASQLYPDVKCCICLEDFNSTNVKKIFLECGHDVCTKCLAKLYETNKEKTSCPKCRGPVSTGFIKHNANIIWAPSAPEEKLQEPQRLYPSTSCCVCMEPFSTEPFSTSRFTTRIFLECGHDICSSCLGKIHEEHKENSKCPLCRKSISTTFIQKNADKIWPFSDPLPY